MISSRVRVFAGDEGSVYRDGMPVAMQSVLAGDGAGLDGAASALVCSLVSVVCDWACGLLRL
jgi:hypothetical protein